MADRTTERVRIKPSLIDSPFWTAFLISSEVILIHKPDGTILAANPAAQKKLGYSIEELEGMSLLDIVVVSEEKFDGRVKELNSKEELTFLALHRRKDGTTFESEVRTRSIVVDGEELIVGIGTDITETRLAEMLNKALERMSSFVGSQMDFENIMGSTVQASREAIGSDSAIIILRRNDEWELQYEDGFNRYIPPGRQFLIRQSSAVLKVIESGKALLINNVDENALMNGEFKEQYGIKSLLMAPLKVKGEVVGLIGFFSHRHLGDFSDNHVDFANKLAYSISLLLETARATQSEKKSQEFLRTVVETVPDGIVVLNKDGIITFVNKETERLLGVPREEMLNNPRDNPRWSLRPISGGTISLDRSPFNMVKKNHKSVHGVDFRTPSSEDGGLIVSVNMSPIFTHEGEFNGAIASLTDVTERRKIREQLAMEKEEMATIMETTPSGIVLFDDDGQIAFLNHSAENILGISRSEAIGRTYDDPEWNLTDYEGNYASKEKLPYNIVVHSRRPAYGIRLAISRSDGRRILLLMNAAPFFNPNGKLSGVIISIQDVTTMMATEKALRVSMKTSNDIIQQIPSGILLFQYNPPSGLTLQSVNPTADAILGGLESRIGMDFDQIWKKGAFFATKEEFMEVVRTGRTLWREGVHYSDLAVDGSFTFRAFYLPNNHLCINFDDVTERIREEALRREAFEQIERNIEHFATLVDRIRNPLSAIIAQAENEVFDPDRIIRRAAEIEFILTKLDRGWLESEQVRDFLKKTL
jgi:PAS domain S-box-containing protein